MPPPLAGSELGRSAQFCCPGSRPPSSESLWEKALLPIMAPRLQETPPFPHAKVTPLDISQGLHPTSLATGTGSETGITTP